MVLLKLSIETFQNEVGFWVLREIIFIRVRTLVIPRHEVVKNKRREHLEISRLQVTSTTASAPSVPVQTWSLRAQTHSRCHTALPPGSLSTCYLISESPADLNNMEATQREVKLEVAGRWTGHNTGTELSGCVYFMPSKPPATDGDAGNSVIGEWVLNM